LLRLRAEREIKEKEVAKKFGPQKVLDLIE
jgi:hypothetical protein